MIELLITLTVLAFGLLGLAGFQAQMIRANTFNKDLTIANSIGTELMEGIVAGGYQDADSTVPLTVYDTDLDGDGQLDDPYHGRFSYTEKIQKKQKATTVSGGGTLQTRYYNEVNVVVQWDGGIHKVSLDTVISE